MLCSAVLWFAVRCGRKKGCTAVGWLGEDVTHLLKNHLLVLAELEPWLRLFESWQLHFLVRHQSLQESFYRQEPTAGRSDGRREREGDDCVKPKLDRIRERHARTSEGGEGASGSAREEVKSAN